jgi:hypothetical protein
MINPDLKDLWIPTGLLLGFQVTLFKWRIEREAEVGDKGDIPRLVPADYVAIVGMLSFVLGAVLLPVTNLAQVDVARWAFGLGALMFIGQTIGLAGHYQLFNRTKKRQFIWFPVQEKIVVALTVLVALSYSVAMAVVHYAPHNFQH